MFDTIIGNKEIKINLEKSIKNGNLSHSYLFLGREGIGKKKIAREFAKSILCLGDKEKEGTECKSCLEFDTDNHPDFSIIQPEGNSLKIDQIRKLQTRVSEKPIISAKKVYLIDDSDKMTTEAQNALLKTLEEPPEFVIIILIGSNESAFLTTIRSRCMILHFQPIPDEEIKNFLAKQYQMENISNTWLKTCQGSIGKAIELNGKIEIYQKVEEFVQHIAQANLLELWKKAEFLKEDKDQIGGLLDYMNVLFLSLAKEDYRYTKGIEIIENTKKRLKSNGNYDMSIDNLILQMKEQIR